MNRVGTLVAWVMSFTMLGGPAYAVRRPTTPADLRRIHLLVGDLNARYRTAVMDYQNRGPLDFLASFRLTDGEQKKIRSTYFKGLPQLPTLQVLNGNTLVLRALRSPAVSIEIVSLDNALIKINGEEFVYDDRQDVVATAEAIEDMLGLRRESPISFHFSLIRTAYADNNPVVFALAGVVGAVLISTLFKHWNKDKDGRQKGDTKVDESSPGLEGGTQTPHALNGGGGVEASDVGGGAGAGTAGGNQPGALAKSPAAVVAPTVPGISSDVDDTVQKLRAANPNLPPLNNDVLAGVVAAGNTCGYAKGKKPLENEANESVQRVVGKFPNIDFSDVGNTHCSGYTYSVFAYALGKNQSTLKLNATQIAALTATNQDGVGPFGQFNANGFGTAELFESQKLGSNFPEESKAMPGDFLKILWRGKGGAAKTVGSTERGHSVIYLGGDKSQLCFASANQSGNLSGKVGCGIRCVPRTEVQTTMFSRLEHLEQVKNLQADTTNKFSRDIRDTGKPLSEAFKSLKIPYPSESPI